MTLENTSSLRSGSQSPSLCFNPKLHHRIDTGLLAGAWRPNSAAIFGSKGQIDEAQRMRAAGYTIVPPDPLANKQLHARFGLLSKLFGAFRAQ